MKYYFAIAALFAVIGFVFYLEVATWRECLADNSFLYCMRVLSK
jgi:hypothetical protein